MRSPYDPALQAKLERARAKARSRWRIALAAILLGLLALFYAWGYADGMARMGYLPGRDVPPLRRD